jgi:outer membrane immunogenic protein
MKKIAFAAAAIAAVAATPAFAQDDAKTVTFNVGPVVGWDHVRLSDGTDSGSDDGVLYGVNAGADFVVGQGGMFVGIEGEITDSSTGEAVTDVFTAGDSASIDASRNLYAGVRVGTRVGTHAKAYVKGGYSNGRFNETYDDGVTTFKGHEDLDGWVLGAGVETKLAPVLLRLEYRYTNYGSVNVDGVDSGINASRHQIVAGAMLSF